MKSRNIILLTVLLVIIDQVAKLIVYNSYMDLNCEVIPGILDFKPVFNSKYSFVNDSIYQRTGMDAGLIFHVILLAFIWLILFLLYRFIKSFALENKTLDVSISLFTAAAICSYLGMLVWEEGILDFLHFKFLGYIICDLKDLYINCFIVLFLISTITIEVKHKIELKDMKEYFKSLFRRKA